MDFFLLFTLNRLDCLQSLKHIDKNCFKDWSQFINRSTGKTIDFAHYEVFHSKVDEVFHSKVGKGCINAV